MLRGVVVGHPARGLPGAVGLAAQDREGAPVLDLDDIRFSLSVSFIGRSL
jgi:hypothetical protein